MTKKNVLITGASGFIGSHVAREFYSQGWNVVGIGRGELDNWRSYGMSAWHCCDVTLDTLTTYAGKQDVIVHCAGGASVEFSVLRPYQDFIKTVDTMAQVLEFIRSHSPQTKLIYPSSAAVYGQAIELPIRESAPLKPISPYGTYKLMGEQLCQLYASRYKLSIAVIRLFSIYGVGLKKQLLWDACNKLSEGCPDFFGTGEETRDWLHVGDAAHLIELAVASASTECPILNGGSGKGVTNKEILLYLAEKLDIRLAPRFSAAIKEGDPSVYIADISKARSLNWRPDIDWRQGVSEYAEWFRQC